MRKISEADIENQILTVLSLKGIFVWKNQTAGYFDKKRRIFRKPKSRFQIKGTSDVLGVYKGRLIAIEVKTDKGRLSPEQKTFLDRINNEGGIAAVCRSVEELNEKILSKLNQIDKQITIPTSGC